MAEGCKACSVDEGRVITGCPKAFFKAGFCQFVFPFNRVPPGQCPSSHIAISFFTFPVISHRYQIGNCRIRITTPEFSLQHSGVLPRARCFGCQLVETGQVTHAAQDMVLFLALGITSIKNPLHRSRHARKCAPEARFHKRREEC